MRFGILGTADIARGSVIPAIASTDHDVQALASRDVGRAQRFVESLEVDIPAVYRSYEALLEADIDAVYNPLPNSLHGEWTKRAADAGLHVLCEKPMTVDAAEAEAVFEHCKDADVTIMEAFMYQFHPRTARAREIVANELSTVRNVVTSFTFSMGEGADDIRLSPELAGGSLMDVGCYPVSAVRGFLGEPQRVSAHALDTRNCGVDTQMTAQFEYQDAHAQLWFGFDTPHRQYYRVEAENGWLEAENVFNPGDSDVTLSYSIDGEHETEQFDGVDSYRREVTAFADAIDRGVEPPIGRAETVGNMRVIDALYRSAAQNETVPVDR